MTDTRFSSITKLTLSKSKYNNFIKNIHLYTSLETLICDNISQLPSNLSHLTSLKHLNCSNNNLTSLPELPISLKTLDCSNNYLTSLPELPNLLKTFKILICSDNELTSLPELPNSLKELDCSNNKLKSLPKLPKSLMSLTCFENKLTSFPELPESLMSLNCSDNLLTSLPEQYLPKSLEVFNCYGNRLTFLPEIYYSHFESLFKEHEEQCEEFNKNLKDNYWVDECDIEFNFSDNPFTENLNYELDNLEKIYKYIKEKEITDSFQGVGMTNELK